MYKPVEPTVINGVAKPAEQMQKWGARKTKPPFTTVESGPKDPVAPPMKAAKGDDDLMSTPQSSPPVDEVKGK